MRGEPVPSLEEATAGLELADQKTKKRLEKIRDMVLFRYNSTGVWAAVQVRAWVGWYIGSGDSSQILP